MVVTRGDEGGAWEAVGQRIQNTLRFMGFFHSSLCMICRNIVDFCVKLINIHLLSSSFSPIKNH